MILLLCVIDTGDRQQGRGGIITPPQRRVWSGSLLVIHVRNLNDFSHSSLYVSFNSILPAMSAQDLSFKHLQLLK